MALAAHPPPTGANDPTQRRFRGSAKLSEYEGREKIGEGTFGKVYKATSRRSGKVYALKQILIPQGMEKDGFPITALRELKLLKMMSHPNVLSLDEMAVEREAVTKGMHKKRANLYMVTPYMDHDLSGMLTNPDIKFNQAQIKCYMLQLLEGVRYLHDSNIFHRDMKAANILVSNQGLLQIADFGLARHYEGVPPQPGKGNGESKRDYTSLVVTRWYRPPELLLVMKNYTPAIDMWGVGCVFAEMFEHHPILQGKTDVDQCVQIFRLVGNPTEDTMPGWFSLPGCEGHKDWEAKKGDINARFGRHLTPEGLDLLKQMLCLDYRKRINAIDAIQHDYFKTAPLPARASDLPKYAHSHELDNRRRGQEQRHAPPAPAGGTVGMGPDEYYEQGYYNGGYGYDRPRGGGYRDRGPPGTANGRYDDRRGPPPPPHSGRQPAWREDARRQPVSNGHPLPPRPGDGPMPPRAGDRAPPPPGVAAGPGARGVGNVDTYIPNYDSRGRPPPPTRDDGYRGAPRDAYRDPDAPPPSGRGYRNEGPPPPRGAYRDPDAPASRGDGYGRAGPGGYDGASGGQRRTRSRSPERDSERRERLQNRERELYQRR